MTETLWVLVALACYFLGALVWRPSRSIRPIVSQGSSGRWYWKLKSGSTTVAICDGSFSSSTTAEADIAIHFGRRARFKMPEISQ